MGKNAKGRLAMCCLAGVGFVPPCAAGQRDANPIVVIELKNPSALATPWLDRARVLVARIYEGAGVSLRWTIDDASGADKTLTIVLTTSSALPRGLGSDAMGVAPSPGDGTRGTTAYVLLDKVSSFAATHRLAVAPVLACALAHEIGHLLLPPNAHRADGVMRDRWHPALFPPRAPGIPGFPIDQGRLLRLRAHRQ